MLAIESPPATLHLPTVRDQRRRLAEAAVRDRLTHRAYLAEVLSAEVDDREARRRDRRIAEARFPRLKRLAEFDLGRRADDRPGDPGRTWPPAPGSAPASRSCCSGDSGTGKTPPPHRPRDGGLRARPPGPLRDHGAAGQRARRGRRRAELSRVVAATAGSTCCASTSSATSTSTGAAPSCCSRSSPSARSEPRSPSLRTRPSSEWGQTFTDPRLAAAVVDRLTFRAHILETGTASYRLRTSQGKQKEGPPAA